ncbi:transglutaminase family protein [Dechloromonas sp. ZY10]|uniref:transglutaminase family protein n=1 Tax=Dechloromonas aquae TaxID=2664436 RepID=UPI0035276A86
MTAATVRYHVLHETRYAYASPVSLSRQQLHLSPRVLAWQQIELQCVEILPAPSWRRDGVDAFGNPVSWVAFDQAHASLCIRSALTLALQTRPMPDLVASPAWESVRDRLAYRGLPPGDEDLEACQFLFESPHVRVKHELAAFAAPCFPPGRPLLQAVTALMEQIFSEFVFDPQATTVSTPILEVLEKKRGVCQDFAHLMIGCLRALGLAARYVSGYLLTRPPPGRPRLIGADASHAWVAVYVPGSDRLPATWVEFDPTNNLLPDTEHITLAFGRDFSDVSPLRGVVLGGGGPAPEVAVTVVPLDEEGLPPGLPQLGEGAAACGG